MSFVCPTCGGELPADSSAGGLCPACLFAQVLAEPGNTAPDEDAALAPGATFGPFQIRAVLGVGGMSTVYQAYEAALNRVVALKVLPPEFLHDDGTFAKRFQQEAHVVAALEHPHIVPLYASGIEGGIPWMSMRLLGEGNLGTLIARQRLSIERTLSILRSVASALDYAHARGIVHRDIKPSNVLLDAEGHVCVGDFGLAHLMERSLVHTRTGVIAGTPHYMAPEMGLGGTVDHRTDIYSLGVVAYEMLTGRPPFDGASPVAILLKHANEPMPAPEDEHVSRAVANVLSRALAKDPNDRWPTASAFAHALEKAVAAPSVSRPSISTVLGIAGALAAAALALVVLQPFSESPGGAVPASIQETAPTLLDSNQTPADPLPPMFETVLPPVETASPAESAAPSTTPGDIPAAGGSIADEPPVQNPVRAPEPPLSDSAPPPPSPEPEPARATPPATPSPPPEATAPASGPETPRTSGSPAARDTAEPTPASPQAEDVVTQPVRVATVDPIYPALARAAEIEGDVVIEATIDADGRVADARILRSAHALLDDAALVAVRQYIYEPGQRNGVPEAFPIQVTVSFRLQ